jgi:dynein heavy chain 1
MDPSVQEMRSYWYKQYNEIPSVVCRIKKLESTKYDKSHDDEEQEVPTFKSILKKMSTDLMMSGIKAIEESIGKASSYISFSGCQALFSVDFHKLYEKVGCNIPTWNKTLNYLKSLVKQNFDSTETIKNFGAVVIDYKAAQDQVNTKFSALQDQVFKKLIGDLGDNMKEFLNTLSSAKSQLELVSLDNPNIDVTVFITEIQEKKRLSEKWEKELVEIYEAGINVIRKYGYSKEQFNMDNLRGQWNNFKQILNKKVKILEDEMDRLQEKVISEEMVVKKKIEETKKEWIAAKDKNFFVTVETEENPDFPNVEAILQFLNIMETKSSKLKNDWKRVCKAKELLDMELSDPEALDGFEETVRDHKEVWSALNKVWSEILEIGEILFAALVPKKVKESLRAIMDSFQELPTKYKQYDSYEEMRARVSKFQSMQNIIIDLKGEAMKSRHWTRLLRQLRIKIQFSELTLKDLWVADVISNKVMIGDIMAQAIGENAIERFLTDVKEVWAHHELDLVKYQTKCRLIRGWDDLFTIIDEQISNLGSTRMSPFVKNFEEEISKWDEKLEEMRIIFDTWIDVQRRWVYLEGIFFGSADIKAQLPQEFARFKSIDNDFISLMKQVFAKPLTMEVYGIPNLQKTLQRLSDMLNKIQKALGDYLETQRSNFARFYFVGDDDLLEIIGNSKDITNIQRHFPKMFAGIATLKSPDGNELQGFYSREGEHVSFKDSI